MNNNGNVSRNIYELEQFSGVLQNAENVFNIGFDMFTSTLNRLIGQNAVMGESYPELIAEATKKIDALKNQYSFICSEVRKDLQEIKESTNQIETKAVTKLSDLLSLDPTKYKEG